MSDKDLANEIPYGVVLLDQITGDGPYLAGGTVPPTSLSATLKAKFDPGDFYLEKTATGFNIYKKFATGNDDWRRFDSTDLPFNPVGFQNYFQTETTVFDALETFGIATFTDLYKRAFFLDSPQSSTTSTGWVNRSQTTTATLDPGVYILRTFGDVGATKKDRQAGLRFLWREDGVTGFAVVKEFIAGIAQDNTFFYAQSNNEITITGNNTVTIQIQFGQRLGGGYSVLTKEVGYELYKVRD